MFAKLTVPLYHVLMVKKITKNVTPQLPYLTGKYFHIFWNAILTLAKIILDYQKEGMLYFNPKHKCLFVSVFVHLPCRYCIRN